VLNPVAAALRKPRVLVVADGALQYVPFGALYSPRTVGAAETGAPRSPLIVDHEIVSLPSASVLAVLRQELVDRQPAEKAIAVLADPVLQAGDSRVKGAMPGHRRAAAEQDTLPAGPDEVETMKLDRLPFTRDEAETIAALVPPEQRLKALDFDASRATVASAELERYRIVHFATHAIVDDRHPDLSGIVLSLVDAEGKPQDGFLRALEIYNVKLRAELVVLSACRTALGKDVKGEGLVGLVRGFMYAGAARVVASMWDVRDRATATLMKRFYEGMLKKNLTPAAALRSAQIAMWKDPRWEAPYYWAGFVIEGEFR
jgi:CHAT domain-containing protein